MNYLAHLALAAPTDASLVGNLLGDFAKGTSAHLHSQFPPNLVEGLLMHRAIDRFTDAHPEFSKAKSLFAPERRRFAGIAIDIIYDHFLSKHWSSFYTSDLSLFIDSVYQTLDRNPQWWIGQFKQAYPYMRHQDWLRCYQTIAGIELTLKRVASRSHSLSPLANCSDDFIKHYDQLERNFLAFYPSLIHYAGSLNRGN